MSVKASTKDKRDIKKDAPGLRWGEGMTVEGEREGEGEGVVLMMAAGSRVE